MDSLFQGFEGVSAYLDDILITGTTPEKYLEHLEKRCCPRGINPSAYQYYIEYKPDRLLENADALSHLPLPTTTNSDCLPGPADKPFGKYFHLFQGCKAVVRER